MKDQASPVPSYFYPINAGMFIEDQDKRVQFVVMNDRPQAASAYHQTENGSRLEYLFMRRTITNDQLGVNEAMDDFA
jgi:hypothetical protein